MTRPMTKQLVVCGTILILLAGLGALGGFFWNAHSGLADAQRLARHELWEYVPAAVDRYLQVFPYDGQARLLMAEALVRGERPVEEAFEHLRQVSDTSPFAAAARTKEGQLELFILNRPSRAERFLQRAIEIDREAVDAYYMMWKLYDLTGRSQLVEPFFWKVYQLCLPEERRVRLSEWYMSQFYPKTANPMLDRLLGIVDESSSPTTETEAQRFIRFRQSEPDGPIGYAALMHWFQQQGEPSFAAELLATAKKSVPAEQQNHPYLLAAQAVIVHDLGQYDELARLLESWPKSAENFEYWLWRGILLEEDQGDYEAALEAYQKAIEGWPGDADWRTRTRMANCAARLGQAERAQELRKDAERIQTLMEEEIHQRLREALTHPDDPAELSHVADFYEELGRPEAKNWREVIDQLSPSSSNIGGSVMKSPSIP